MQVFLRPGSTPSGPIAQPLVTTVVLFILFGGGSLVFREHFARKHRAAEAQAGTAGELEAGITSGVVDEPAAVEALSAHRAAVLTEGGE